MRIEDRLLWPVIAFAVTPALMALLIWVLTKI